MKRQNDNGITIYRNGPERTETDRNGPKRTFVDTETDSLSTERTLWVPKRTGTDRNGPERTETDFRGYRNGLSEYRNGLSGYRNGPERTETDFHGYRNGLSENRNGLSGYRNGTERTFVTTETDCGYRIVIWGFKVDRNTKNRYKLQCQAVQIGYVE